jgi:proliferating cell nuclear antigen
MDGKIVQIKIKHGHEFKTLIDVLKQEFDEVRFDFIRNVENFDTQISTYESIRISALNDQQTLLASVKLNSEQFVEFYVKPEIYSVVLNLIQVHEFIEDFMKDADEDCTVGMTIEQNDEQNIVFSMPYDVKTDAFYKQKLLRIGDKPKSIQQIIPMILVSMDPVYFNKICSEMNRLFEYVEITCTDEEITFKCQRDGDIGAYVKTFKNSDERVRIISLKNPDKPNIFRAKYNLKHFVAFEKCINLCTQMKLYMSDGYPIFIECAIGLLGRMYVGVSPVDEKNDQYCGKKLKDMCLN